MNNNDINKLLSQLSPPKCDNNFSKRVTAGKNNFSQDYNKLSNNIISFGQPSADHRQTKNNDFEDTLNNKMSELRSFENPDIFHRPKANLSNLNRNFFLENDKHQDINQRFQNYEPLPKNHNVTNDRFSNYELNKNNYRDDTNQRINNLEQLTSNRVNKSEFNTMIFSSKRNDNNQRFQQYVPLPRNVQYSINTPNKMVSDKIIPSNSRVKYDFKN